MSTYTVLADLERIRSRYQNKRTIGYQLLDEVLNLAERAIAEAQREAEARADGRIVEADRQVEQLRKDRDQWRAHYNRVERALDEKRTIREEREAARKDGDTDVTISNGYVGWTVAGLEEIAYRLRWGGAEDDTPVEVDKNRAKASVPAPNLVQLEYRPKPPVVSPEPCLPDPARPQTGLRPVFPLPVLWVLVGLAAVLLVAFGGVVL